MENKRFRNYYLFSLFGVFLVSCYPIYMGISVLVDMIRYGTVYAENYPKYIIPYTPIALSLLVGVALIPTATKHFKKYALLGATTISTATFFAAEMMLEKAVIVTRTITETVGWIDVSKLEEAACIPDERTFRSALRRVRAGTCRAGRRRLVP